MSTNLNSEFEVDNVVATEGVYVFGATNVAGDHPLEVTETTFDVNVDGNVTVGPHGGDILLEGETGQKTELRVGDAVVRVEDPSGATGVGGLVEISVGVGGTIRMGGVLDMSGNDIKNIAEPTEDDDAVPKSYVDDALAGKSDVGHMHGAIAQAAYGFVYMTGQPTPNTNEVKVSCVQNTPTKITAPTTASNTSCFTHTQNRLTYTGTNTRDMLINASICGYTEQDYLTFMFTFYRNGSPTSIVNCVDVYIGVDEGKADKNYLSSCSMTGIVTLCTNDYIELWCENRDSDDDLFLRTMSWTATAIGPDGGSILQGELGILDTMVNSGINLATGVPWASGDTYRLCFLTSITTDATQTDIAHYNAHVNTAASSNPALGTGWTAIMSSASVHAKDNTSTDPAGALNESIIRLDSVPIAANYADLWNGSILNITNLTEDGVTVLAPGTEVWTGTGTNGEGVSGRTAGSLPNVTTGRNNSTFGNWVQHFNRPVATQFPLYAVSPVLTVQ